MYRYLIMFDRKNSCARKGLDYLKYTPWFYTFIFGGKDLPWLITKFTQFVVFVTNEGTYHLTYFS